MMKTFLLVLASGHIAKSKVNQHNIDSLHDHSFVRALDFKHRLRVCNAYPYNQGFDILRGKDEKLTEASLAYKSCVDFKVSLKSGDKIRFEAGGTSAGTFSIQDLPNNDAIMLLVVYRHDVESTAVSFESHVYANLLNAQIAVIDTYKGSKKSTVRIEDHSDSKTSRSEELRYNSVVAVNPGKYECILVDATGNSKPAHAAELVALNRESYVVLRVGVESKTEGSYSEELVVYPQSNPDNLSSASSMSITMALFAGLTILL